MTKAVPSLSATETINSLTRPTVLICSATLGTLGRHGQTGRNGRTRPQLIKLRSTTRRIFGPENTCCFNVSFWIDRKDNV